MLEMKEYSISAVRTEYWMPNSNYLDIIVSALSGRVKDGDIIVISEKALSIAKGLIVDEKRVKAGFLAGILARFWMRIIWGYFLGRLCHLRKKNIQRLRRYPCVDGSRHKQVALRYAGFLEALLWGSEGGIDGSNLPYAYVCLPLDDPQRDADEIRLYIQSRLGKRVAVMIVDTDKTYSFRNFHFTHRPVSFDGIHRLPAAAYILGRMLRLKRRSTPIAISGMRLDVESALNIAEAANRARGFGAGRTVWDMADRFGVDLTDVTWEMLRRIEHKPIVIVRVQR